MIFLSLSTLLRLFLLIKEFSSLSHFLAIPFIFLQGFLSDLCPLLFLLSFLLLCNLFIWPKLARNPVVIFFQKFFLFIFIVGLVFTSIAECFFWNEFVSRFNFIAVDYLVYTNEVLKNLMESYPMKSIIGGILLLSLVIYIVAQKFSPKIFSKKYASAKTQLLYMQKSAFTFLFIIFSISYYVIYAKVLDRDLLDNLALQLSSNGIYRFVEAFRSNQIDYLSFYKVLPNDLVQSHMEKEFARDASVSKIERRDFSITKKIKRVGEDKKYNVVYVLIESLGGKYIGSLGNKENITPYLDKLSEQSLFFTRLFASGTRTVRGLEATVLSVPPTPGYSIVKRPNNENLNSMGTVFKNKGYDLKFLYGGYALFDNMSYFFSNNHFNVVDRYHFTKDEVQFETAWGTCDEDLFTKALKEADQSYATHKPFFQFMLTTSNHRPFTYPEGRIDIPSKTGRSGAVKYTDYAIGKFLEAAQKKPWFDHTIFVLIADHSTEGRGTFDLTMSDFHIPAWIYAPKIIKPQKINQAVAQIDILPTLLGILNFSYDSHFFGQDFFDQNFVSNIFFGNYQHVGFYQDGNIVSLGPKKSQKNYLFDLISMQQTATDMENPKVTEQAISFYQFASLAWKNGEMKEDFSSSSMSPD